MKMKKTRIINDHINAIMAADQEASKDPNVCPKCNGNKTYLLTDGTTFQSHACKTRDIVYLTFPDGTKKAQAVGTDPELENIAKSFEEIKRIGNLSSDLDVVNFLVNYYDSHKLRPVKNTDNTFLKYSIYDSSKFIGFDEKNRFSRAKVIITYINSAGSSEVHETESEDFADLVSKWTDFSMKNNLSKDCILWMDVDLTDEEKQYIDVVNTKIKELFLAAKFNPSGEHWTPSDYCKILVNITASGDDFKGNKLIYPRKVTKKMPNGREINMIKLYL